MRGSPRICSCPSSPPRDPARARASLTILRRCLRRSALKTPTAPPARHAFRQGHDQAAGVDILEAFEDPDFEEGSAEQLLRRAYNHLELAQTEVLVLDELQHLINTDTTRATAWSVTETIKRMLIRGACPMILIGTEEARPVLLTNPQMKSRCLEPIFLDPLEYKLPDEWECSSTTAPAWT